MDKNDSGPIDWSKVELTSVNTHKFESPPEPNWRFYVGDNIKNNIRYNVYLENPPNRLQRWLWYKAFRLTWEQIK